MKKLLLASTILASFTAIAQPRPIPRPTFIPIPVCIKAEIIVKNLPMPTWDNVSKQSVILAEIQNIGRTATGTNFVVEIITDKGVHQARAARALNPGETTTVEFRTAGWIFDPDASYSVTADYGNLVDECNENNNTTKYFLMG